MNVKVSVTDTALPFVQGMEKQLPFAVARALTWVAEDVKFTMAKHVSENFTVRRPWVASPNRWKVTQARKEDHPNQFSRVDLDHEAPFLADFENGKVRHPGDRAYDRIAALMNQIYVPTRSLRPAFSGVIPAALGLKNIGINARLDPAGAIYTAGKGKHSRKTARLAVKRFFRMRPRVTTGQAAGVWERFGSGKGLSRGNDQIRFIYKAVSSVRVPKRLHTLEWAQAEVMKQWPDKMQRSWALAVATAR